MSELASDIRVRNHLQPDSPAISLDRISAGYGSRTVIENVSLQIRPGCVTGIIGPNGGGKTTLVKVILGLLSPFSGKAIVNGHRPDEMRLGMGYVPQQESVDWSFPIIVREVVTMGRYGRLGLIRRPSAKDHRVVMDVLEKVGLKEYADRQIGELSGGQRHRVFLARALAQDPDIIVLDEPLSDLDPQSQHDLVGILKAMAVDHRTVVVTTHDLSCVAENFADVVCLNKTVVAVGKPAEVLTSDILGKTYDQHMLVLGVQEGGFLIGAGHTK